MEVLPSPVGSILTNYFCKRRRRWRDPPIAFPGSAWWGGKPGPGQASPAQPSPWAWRNPHGHIWHRRRLGHKSMVQIPLAGGDDPLCKLTFPPSRASAKVVSLRFWLGVPGFCWARPQNQGLPESNFFYYMYSRKVASCFAWDFGISCREVLRTPAAQPGLATPSQNPNWWTFAPACLPTDSHLSQALPGKAIGGSRQRRRLWQK